MPQPKPVPEIPEPAPGWRRWMPKRAALEQNRWLRWAAPWLGHAKLWSWSRRGVALGVALGVFFGLLIPLAQIPVTAAAAIVLRANLPAAAASTFITNPITFGPLYYGAYQLGNWITGERGVPAKRADIRQDPEPERSMWQRIRALGKPMLVGLSIIASAMGLLTYLVINLAWRFAIWRKRRQRLRRSERPDAAPRQPTEP